MKIYTKTGDSGQTSLIGGTRAGKDTARLEAYGTVDELNAHLGMIRSLEAGEEIKQELVEIQQTLFVVGASLATDPAKIPPAPRPLLDEGAITFLERAIDLADATLPSSRHFILPGGHPTVAACHVARTVCRRAERRVVALSKEDEVDCNVLRYLNRLSDYLFILARRLSRDLGAEEINWEPKTRK
ncbi:MAG: cob(I)yrinic acid a,c-diamide adenosyltransferase [Odoribacteraceae bacterium]|jgi:cob(I)alamin adenosyltransferase|nr:cob(I)yrinic acid a,c-diamide adenosyltransferase [Odoribacteraceae bacterium]